MLKFDPQIMINSTYCDFKIKTEEITYILLSILLDTNAVKSNN